MSDVTRRLDALLRDCARHAPFYRRCWGPDLTGRAATDGVSVFAQLPLVTKAELLAADPGARLHERWRRQRLSSETTSGSSGQPFTMPLDPASIRQRRRRFLQALLDCGYRPGQRLLLISSQSTQSVRRRVPLMRHLGWHYADVDQPAEALAKHYRQTRPDILYGPLTALLHLAASATRTTHDRHLPLALISTGEQLMPQHQRLLAAAFGAPVHDFYGMTELGLVAWRRADRQAYRCPGEAFHLEFLPLPGEPDLERLVVTDLRGGALPLIRYETGDLVRRDRLVRGQPIVGFVGRALDSIRLPGERLVSPYRLMSALESVPGLAEYRVLQLPDRSIEVSVRSAPGAHPPTEQVAARLLAPLCPGVAIRVRHLEQALPAAAEKLRPIRSLAGMAP